MLGYVPGGDGASSSRAVGLCVDDADFYCTWRKGLRSAAGHSGATTDYRFVVLLLGLFILLFKKDGMGILTQLVLVTCVVEEGTKVRWAQQQMISSMDKAKEKYDRKCQEAIEITATMRKSDNTSSAESHSSSSDSSSDEVSASKELTDKLAAGAGQLLTKMWDTTSAFGRNPLERQRSKLYGCLEEVIATEKHYLQTVEYTNAQRLICERKIKENLHAFQLTEEQRLEYLRDVLVRMQKAFIDMISRSEQFVERMKTSVNEVDELGTHFLYYVCNQENCAER